MHAHSYRNLALMATLSFFAMYVLMYAMVDSFGNVVGNVNQIYMAGLMTSPMILIEMLLMRGMYGNRLLNMLIILGSIVLGLACWFGIRWQIGIDERQFLASMIPHHGGAILMCEKAKLADPAIQALCNRIIESQQTEIDWMKDKLEAME